MHGNALTKDAVDPALGNPVWEPSPLPDIWAAGTKRGFPMLKQLLLYPGNEYLCSIPDNDAQNLGYRDVNLGKVWASGGLYHNLPCGLLPFLRAVVTGCHHASPMSQLGWP